MNDKPSYFGILPAPVRYDKRLVPMARVFYSELTALTQVSGCCTAPNSYFAKAYEVSEATISKWVSSLAKCGHIKVQTVAKNGMTCGRKIWIANAPEQGGRVAKEELESLAKSVFPSGQDVLPSGQPNTNIYTPLVGKKKETFIPPTEKEVKKLMLAALEKLNKTVTADEWADWETEKFIEYWEGENWKRKGKVMKSIARSVTTWIKNGAEKAKYTKPAPNSASYGEKAPIRDERPDIELSEAWEASYQKFTTMFYEGLGEYRTKKVRTLSRQEYVDWTTWKRRPVARRVFNGRANWFCEYAIKWAKKVGVKASSYRLQHELKTTDALLNEVVDYYMKEFGMVGEFVEAA
jgi:hypothetical protein